MVSKLDTRRCASEEAKPPTRVDTRWCVNKDAWPRRGGLGDPTPIGEGNECQRGRTHHALIQNERVGYHKQDLVIPVLENLHP